MVGKQHVGLMVWAAWPASREVFNLKLLDVTQEASRWDEWAHEWTAPEPWMAEFGPASGTRPGRVHNPTCATENVFLTEAAARACVREYCLSQARAGAHIEALWTKLAEMWV